MMLGNNNSDGSFAQIKWSKYAILAERFDDYK